MLLSMEKHRLVRNGGWLDLLIFVLFANVFLFHAFGTVALWLILAGMWILLIRLFEPDTAEMKNVKWIGTGVLLSTLAVYLTVNSVEKAIVLILVALSTMLVAVFLWLKREPIGGILELSLSGLVVMREYLVSAWQLLRGMVEGNLRKVLSFNPAKKEKSPWVKSVMVGFVVGLPLIAWLVLTLSKADPVFQTYIKALVSEKLLSELPGRIFLSTLLLVVLIPTILMKWRGYKSPVVWLTKVAWGREMVVVTGMVAVVLGLFLVVQWPYVFVKVAQETDLSRYGVATYSEYVQKGFGEMLKVVVMVFGVAWVGLLLNKNQAGQTRKLLLLMQGILGAEFGVFIGSIIRRVWLYQSYHGLSLARLYGLALLITVVGMTLTMAMRYVKSNVKWVKVEAAWIVCMIFATVLVNMEALVVMDPPTVNKRVDYVYLSRLSSDGKEGWVQAYAWAQELLARQIQAENPNGHIYIFNREERRDIFYAGLIGRQLAAHYYDWVMQYGTDDELRDFYRQVVKTELVELQTPGLEAAARSDKNFEASRNQAIETLKKYGERVEQPDWQDKMSVTPVYREGYDWGMLRGSPNRGRAYFAVDDQKEWGRLSGWDYALAFDPSQKGVYQWMRQEIGIEKILHIESMDLSLQQRIVGEPGEDKSFDVDISLASPFVQ